MLKISLIEPVGGHGGNEFYDIGLCEYLSKENVDVTLYSCDETRLDQTFKCSFIIQKYYKKIYGKDNKIIRGFRYLRGTIDSLIDSVKRKIDIAHFHIYHFSLMELFNILIFCLVNKKCVITVHDVESFDRYGTKDESKIGYKTKFILLFSQAIIVHSNLAKNALKEIGVSSNKICYVPHGDTDFVYNKNKISKIGAKNRLSIGKEKLTLLFFGQIKAVKGLDVLIKAIPEIDDSVQLLVVGKCWKQDLDDYLSLANDLDVVNRIRFVNEYIPNEDVPNYFLASDFVCLPYKKIYSSGVVLRAMDYESTIVCSDLDPLKAVITNNRTGVVFKSENYHDLANKINYLVNDDKLRKQLAKNAKEFIQKNYSWEIVAKSTKKVYEKTLEGKVDNK